MQKLILGLMLIGLCACTQNRQIASMDDCIKRHPIHWDDGLNYSSPHNLPLQCRHLEG